MAIKCLYWVFIESSSFIFTFVLFKKISSRRSEQVKLISSFVGLSAWEGSTSHQSPAYGLIPSQGRDIFSAKRYRSEREWEDFEKCCLVSGSHWTTNIELEISIDFLKNIFTNLPPELSNNPIPDIPVHIDFKATAKLQLTRDTKAHLAKM